MAEVSLSSDWQSNSKLNFCRLLVFCLSIMHVFALTVSNASNYQAPLCPMHLQKGGGVTCCNVYDKASLVAFYDINL